MKIKNLLHPWRNIVTYDARSHSERLRDRLQKFCVLDTPRSLLDIGETWGNGQVQIAFDDKGVWRGQIDSGKLPKDWIQVTEDAVQIHLELSWFAQRLMIRGLGKGDPLSLTWMRDSDSQPYHLHFAVESFYQNKAGKRIFSPKFFPKRLFFRTTDGDEGFFTRNSDPENLQIKGMTLYDPSQEKLGK